LKVVGFSTCSKYHERGEGIIIYYEGQEIFLDKVAAGMLAEHIKEARKKSILITCDYCGKKRLVYPSQLRWVKYHHFCSRECYHKWQRKK